MASNQNIDGQIHVGLAKKLIQNYEKVQAKAVPRKRRKVLLVLAHMEKESFNGALFKATLDKLRELGDEVLVSDLYKMNFNPVIGKGDIKDYTDNGEPFKYPMASRQAWEEGKLSEELQVEQRKVKAADLIIFQFPLQWYSWPAILKGWIERVFTGGFAYDYSSLYDEGPLQGKLALLSFTTGGPQTWYTPRGINGDINMILWPMQMTLKFCGLDLLAPHICFSPAYMSDAARQQVLTAWTERLESLANEKTLINFVPTEKFINFQLPESADEELVGKRGTAPSVGQHLGLPMPVDAMRRTKKI